MQFIYNYFIKKFESIPESKWFVDEYSNENDTKFCAYGHCGMREGFRINDLVEPFALKNIFNDYIGTSYDNTIPIINDGDFGWKLVSKSPKERILLALYTIKEFERL